MVLRFRLTLPILLLLALASCDRAPRAAPIANVSPTTAQTATSAARSTTPATPPTARPIAAAASPTATPDPTAAQEAFAARLRGRGLTVERLSEAAQPYFRVHGARLRLSGGPLAQPVELQAFSYPEPALAAEGAARVQPDTSARWTEPDGRGRGMTSTWVATPHFFHSDGTIVVYVGDDAALLTLLADLLGPQYAGR